MNILLINPIARARSKPNVFPTGLGYIASVCREEGHNVQVLDFNGNRVSLTYTFCKNKALNPDVIGITGIVTQYKEVKELAKQCKEFYPKAPIICGGTIASSISELLLKKTEVDVCVRGEGEETIKRILEIGVGLPLSGTSTKTGTIVHWNDRKPIQDLLRIPRPAYDLFPMETYITNPIGPYNPNKWKDGNNTNNFPRSMNMIATRGCLFSCQYCYHNFMGQGYRMRPVHDVIDEMESLKDQYDIEYIHFVDDAFAINKKWLSDFCEQVYNTDIAWSCTGRANLISDDLCCQMKKAGCIGIWLGLESGSDEMLRAMNKQATTQDYRRAIPILRKYFGYEDYTFIIGTPGETTRTVMESIEFCKGMHITPTALFYMTPYPGTSLFEMLRKKDVNFKARVDNIDGVFGFERWIESLGEQGETIAWDCCGVGKPKLKEWHEMFCKETGVWNT